MGNFEKFTSPLVSSYLSRPRHRGGHPIGAAGVRMVLYAANQVNGRAGKQQVEGSCTAMTVNVGGSFTTAVATVVTRGAR